MSLQGVQSSTVCVGSCEGADGLEFCSKGLEAEAARMTSLSKKESKGCSDIQSCKTTCSFRVFSSWLLFKIINFVNMCFCSDFFLLACFLNVGSSLGNTTRNDFSMTLQRQQMQWYRLLKKFMKGNFFRD